MSKWWSRNKTWVVPVAIGAAITVAAVALAPATGGASLGALAFAANGGMFDEGQLFIAREAGAELVGNIGNHATVANNQQIIDGISNGVANANAEQNALLRQQNQLLTAILQKTGSGIPGASSALGRVVSQSLDMYSALIGG